MRSRWLDIGQIIFWRVYGDQDEVEVHKFARWLYPARSGSQLQREIWFILPARGASHIITCLIIWLAPWAGKMNQIARCDWLPERARWSHLARSGLPAASRKQNFTKSHIINPLLTKFVQSRWLDIGLGFFCEFINLNFVSVHNLANIQ